MIEENSRRSGGEMTKRKKEGRVMKRYTYQSKKSKI